MSVIKISGKGWVIFLLLLLLLLLLFSFCCCCRVCTCVAVAFCYLNFASFDVIVCYVCCVDVAMTDFDFVDFCAFTVWFFLPLLLFRSILLLLLLCCYCACVCRCCFLCVTVDDVFAIVIAYVVVSDFDVVNFVVC